MDEAAWLKLAPPTSPENFFFLRTGICIPPSQSSSTLIGSMDHPLEQQPGGELVMLKSPGSQFKGVVPQLNGRFGAQIYEKNHRLWLGTFNSEAEAAKAYDVAATKLRGCDALTNFPPVAESEPESAFLNLHSTEQIIDMLKKHTYSHQLKNTSFSTSSTTDNINNSSSAESCLEQDQHQQPIKPSSKSVPRQHLFHKVVTPSDVGKLNRLVIPKQHAVRCFPMGEQEKAMLLSFEDEGGKHWMFRYSYWSSSQSYVLTRGWSRFVKEKRLEVGDIVIFDRDIETRLFINCRRKTSSVPAAAAAARPLVLRSTRHQYHHHHHYHSTLSSANPTRQQQQLQFIWTTNAASTPEHLGGATTQMLVSRPVNDMSSSSTGRRTVFRLFGVEIRSSVTP